MEASEQCGRQRRRANRVYRAQPSGTLAAFSWRLFPNYSAGKSQGMLVLGAEICWMYAEPILHDLSSFPRLALRAKRSDCLRKIHYSHVTTFTSLPHHHPLLALTLPFFLYISFFFICFLLFFFPSVKRDLLNVDTFGKFTFSMEFVQFAIYVYVVSQIHCSYPDVTCNKF